ncbi:unnamed protein product [Prunus armeniaca]
MELLPDFLFTVVFSLLMAFWLSFVLPLVISMCPSRDANDHVGKRRVLYECESPVEPEIHDWRSEIRGGFVEKVVKFEEFIGEEPKEESFLLQDFVDESSGSPTGHEGSKTDEYEVCREVGVVCLSEKSVDDESSGGHGCLCGRSENMVDQSSERHEFGEIEVDLTKNEVGIFESEDIKFPECDGSDHEADRAKESVVDGVEKEGLLGEDDWEGIERTELERLFGAAVVFVGSKSNAERSSSVGSDVKTRLDGLHKIATRGPCFEPQPMAFKVSARAKWNAWQQLGNMSAEVAMEQYITLLSERVPGWMQDVHGDFADAQVYEKIASDLKTFVQNQSEPAGERKVEELKPDFKGLDETGVRVLNN